MIAAQIDLLASEGKMLAKKLEEAGMKVTYKHYAGVTHEFFGMAAVPDEAKAAQEEASKNLNAAFASKKESP